MLWLTFSSKLDWGSYIVLLKLPPRKSEPWFVLWSFFLLRLLYLYKSTIRPCMEYSCHVWTVAPSCCLELLDKLQTRICRIVVPSLAVSLEPMAHYRSVASLSFFIGVTLVDVHLNWLNRSHFYILKRGLVIILKDCIISLSAFVDVTRMSIPTVSFLAQLNSWILCR